MFKIICAIAIVSLAVCAGSALAIPAFPGAEGYGANSVGGRGGYVYHVTSLSDDPNTPGTLRYGIQRSTGGTTVVFDVSGIITLGSKLEVDDPNTTIAGQTAPGLGILVRNNTFELNDNNLIVRHIHSRLGNDAGQPAVDSIGLTGGSNVIVDHCSASWSLDEALSAADTATTATVQYCYITEALNSGGHSYGSLIKPDVNAWYSWHHNLWASNYSRNPRPGYYNDSTVLLDFRNNVVYNWQDQAGYTEDDGNGHLYLNYIGSYFIAGPSTGSTKVNYAFNAKASGLETLIYQSSNKIDPNKDGIFNGTDTGWGMFTGSYGTAPGGTMFSVAPVTTQTADAALATVLTQGGAFNWNRDSVDTRVTNDVYNGTGQIISYPTEVGGWPTYPVVSRPAGFDTDSDGMPNYWEVSYGLDPNVADNNGDFDADGYTNLEEYLNWIAPIPAPKPIVWTGGTGRYELIGNWDIPWQPSRYDAVQINTGKATVAYLGQEAGTMYVGSSAAELAVTGGSLAVANGIYLGNASGSRGTLTATGGSLVAGGQIVVASSAASTGELTITRSAYVQAEGLTASNAGGRYAKINLEISPSGSSLIHATGSSSLGGVVDALWLGANRPKEGDAFKIIDSSDPNATYSGAFDSLLCDEITLGIPSGLDPFGGRARSGDYELFFQGLTYGDASGDHAVGTGDLALMAGSWLAGGKAWANGDFTGDGVVGTGDLALMAGNWLWVMPSPAPDQPIPEPATMGLLALSSLALLRHRR